ncbi:MAG: branched-chain amino acid ABC transporter permease [Hyphomonadaceae bacterium]|jgi:branched-chain amino acid transport system permease protein|nr:branched-chain amino acid ABC transporter permease [Hyphomonadaceae bacterium]
MLYRQAGIRHRRYAAERQLWPLTFDRVLVGGVVLFLLAAPFTLDRLYLGSYLLPWLLWSSAALGLNLLMGGAGQIHLGYGAVMAIGAYTSVHLVRSGIPFELALVLAGMTSAALGIVFGAAALRVKGLYLAMSTLAMQYIIDFTISHVPGISGGTQASLQVPRVTLLGMPVTGEVTPYYVALGLCAVITLFMLNVGRTSFGRALAAIREKDYAAEIIGVGTFKYKLLAFWVSSFIGGVVGAVLAVCYLRIVTPDQFHLDLSIQLVAMVIVGGLGSVLGSFFGAALILFAPIFFNNAIGTLATQFGLGISTDLRSHIPLMLYGALIILFLLVEPLGLAKIYDNVRKYFLVWPFRHVRK